MDEETKLEVARQPVILNVYDMFWTNDYTANVGVGVYHSGLEVYGREYAYGKLIDFLQRVELSTPRVVENVFRIHLRHIKLFKDLWIQSLSANSTIKTPSPAADTFSELVFLIIK